MGSYECTASTNQHSSSSSGILIVKDHFKFNVTISPPNIDVDVGGSARFTCKIYPPLPNQVVLYYTWSRVDKLPISGTVDGLNTNTLTLVSNNKLLLSACLFIKTIIILQLHVQLFLQSFYGYSWTFNMMTLDLMYVKHLLNTIRVLPLVPSRLISLSWMFIHPYWKLRLAKQ